MRINFKMTLSKLLFLIPLIYIIICLFIYFYQRNLLYHPGENNYLDEGPLTHKIQKISVNSKNDLVGWYFFKNKNFKTILFFHGNAGKLDNRIYKLNEFEKMDVNYLIFAYRGFSGNKGKPSESGLYEDALAAKKWLNSKEIEDKNIILYGESLGTAIAINLAKDNSFSGVILESPFTSMETLAKKYYPYLPVSILLKDKFNSIDKLNMNNAVITSGYFNPIHSGHLEYFEISKNDRDKLFVIVNNDYQRKLKGSKEFMKEKERITIVNTIGLVDIAFLSIDTDRSVVKTIQLIYSKFSSEYKLFFANGGDQNNEICPERDVCNIHGIQLIDGLGKKIQSSSWLLKK